MGLADNLKNTALEKQREFQNRDEVKEIFDDIIQECTKEAGYGRRSLTYHFDGYGGYGYMHEDYKPPIEKLVKMLKKEGFSVYIKESEITHEAAYGPTYTNVWTYSKKEIDKAKEEDWRVIGTEYYFEIKW